MSGCEKEEILKEVGKITGACKERPIVKATAAGNILGFSEEDKKNMEEIDNKITQLQLVGGEKTNTVAGVICFLACQKSKNSSLKIMTIRQLCDKNDFTENTVKKFYDKITKERPNDFGSYLNQTP